MKKLKWFYKSGSFETYSVLDEDDRFILVRNDETGLFSFGPRSCFGSLYGFGVNESCLTAREAVVRLNSWISIDTGFSLLSIGRWRAMIEAINATEEVLK